MAPLLLEQCEHGLGACEADILGVRKGWAPPALILRDGPEGGAWPWTTEPQPPS